VRFSRAAIAAATAVTLGASLSACGGGSDASSGGKVAGHVTMWTYPVIADQATHQGFWDKTVADFEKSNPDVKVDVKIFPWAKRDEALTTAIAAQKGPDVAYLIPDQLSKYNAQHALEPVDSYLDTAAKSDYRPNVRNSVTFEGKMLGAPVLVSSISTLCDKRVFNAVGQTTYPETWADVLAMAPKFKAAGYDVTEYQGDLTQTLNQTFYPLLWQAGGDVFSKDGKKVAFNSDQGVEALTFLKKLVDGGYVDKALITEAQKPEQTRFAQGKTGCILSLSPQDVKPFWGNENIVVRQPLKQTAQATYGTVGSFSMLKQSKDKKAAGAWISYITSPEVMKAYDTASSFFAPKTSVGSLYGSDPVLGELEKTVNYSQVGPLHPKARDVMGILAPQIQAALLGKQSPKAALDDAAHQAEPLL
jgi:multiple sugar transport system substrate-binding protein